VPTVVRPEHAHRAPRTLRLRAAVVCGTAGIVGYNWWVLVALKPGLMRSPSELFSDLEVPGQPFAGAMRVADFVSGVLLFTAFLFLSRGPIARMGRELNAMLVFAMAGVMGAIFPEACADGLSNSCRIAEVQLQLPMHHYLHIAAGVFEFGAITLALFFAVQRTSVSTARIARIYRGLRKGAIIAYPLLGLAYVTNDLGAVMEGVFFVGFSVMLGTLMAERVLIGREERAFVLPSSDRSIVPSPPGGVGSNGVARSRERTLARTRSLRRDGVPLHAHGKRLPRLPAGYRD
jgi:hypothetical protein